MSTAKSNWSDAEQEEIKLFQEYLRIRTDHPDIDYEPCVEFLLKQGRDLSLETQVFHPHSPSKPIVVLTWHGTAPDLPSILLNSHMDVVAVVDEYWTHQPFAAEIDKDGKLFARGSQDMKCVGMQYLAAIRNLKREGIRLKRTIHVVYTPEEETGGTTGMQEFVNTDDFNALKIGFGLDEGLANPINEFSIFYGERYVWEITIKCEGKSGHASLFLEDTAIAKVHFLIDKFLKFRETEEKRLLDSPDLTIGDVTTVNITMVNGGIQPNVVPPEFTMLVNARMSVNIDVDQFERNIQDWCEQAGSNIEVNYWKLPRIEPTKINDDNIYWKALKGVFKDLNVPIKPQIFPGATDSRHLRGVNIPVIGFSPMRNTPILLHEHDEYLRVDTYLEGINIYETILSKIGNL